MYLYVAYAYGSAYIPYRFDGEANDICIHMRMCMSFTNMVTIENIHHITWHGCMHVYTRKNILHAHCICVDIYIYISAYMHV